MNSVVVNVFGKKYEILKTTFDNFPIEFLSKFVGSECSYKNHQKLYYLERHPDVFKYILYYYQFGELHMPRSICPSLFKKELDYWGIDVSSLENCCLDVYGMAFENLRRLDDFEQDYEMKTEELATCRFSSKWRSLQKTIWQILDNPFASKYSEVFYWTSILFVFLSIFALAAATHPLFKTYSKLEENSHSFAGHFEWTADWTRPNTQIGENAGTIGDYDEDFVYGGSSGNITEDQPTYSGYSASFHHKTKEIALLEFVCFIFFTVEVVLKLIFCPKLKVFFGSVLNVVDLLAIFPLYILLALDFLVVPRELLGKVEEIFEGIAVLRVFRLLRLARRVRGLRVLLYAIKAGLKDVLLLCLMLLMATIIFASLMYYMDTRKEFPSIPHSLWWAIVTLTTVGYGDMTPQTAQGKLLGSVCAITGLLIVAITVPIFVSKFLLYYNHVARKNQVNIPQCKSVPAAL